MKCRSWARLGRCSFMMLLLLLLWWLMLLLNLGCQGFVVRGRGWLVRVPHWLRSMIRFLGRQGDDFSVHSASSRDRGANFSMKCILQGMSCWKSNIVNLPSLGLRSIRIGHGRGRRLMMHRRRGVKFLPAMMRVRMMMLMLHVIIGWMIIHHRRMGRMRRCGADGGMKRRAHVWRWHHPRSRRIWMILRHIWILIHHRGARAIVGGILHRIWMLISWKLILPKLMSIGRGRKVGWSGWRDIACRGRMLLLTRVLQSRTPQRITRTI
jgi:hypothetical protein